MKSGNHKAMLPIHPQSGIFGLIFTVLLYWFTVVSSQELAAIATMFSGACVGTLALYRLLKEIRRTKK